ncbi:hypothetical protein KY345_02155 [Candidatus Woesearchaeota archaeon]|nr:hypothetical protein [Candidatus Woesearchaeota archaeon]
MQADEVLVADLDLWKKRDTGFFGKISDIRVEKTFLKKTSHVNNDIREIEEFIKNKKVEEEIDEFKKLAKLMPKVNRAFITEVAIIFKVFMHVLHMEKILLRDVEQAKNAKPPLLPPKTAEAEINELSKDLRQSLADLETIRLMVHKEEAEIQRG